ncbi:hypothetical protein GCM10007938_08410 [Vibrio zhanjiangensis]|uniref:DUF4123 domain-containing protein n=1 Tax=Vibrio zhanjiangensis TaxID=1046128 RepID=A0ABQ6EVN9_9VIBR|nr:DUF4123 domain-containing protein [Vibrio zhanjiangensis]GLT17064.1 hypothetical protein GCM10007938_08410 [Vibrio zhanjiangensis]
MSNTQLTTQWRIQSDSVPHLVEGQSVYAIIEPQLWPDWRATLSAYIEPLDVQPLMAGTRLSHLPNGPMFIPLNNLQEALQACVEEMSASPCGCLVWSPNTIATEAVATSLRQRLFMPTGSGETLFRYYEPRALLPLMASLSDDARKALFPLLSRLQWHDGTWMSVSLNAPVTPTQPIEPWTLSQEQLSTMQRIAQQW